MLSRLVNKIGLILSLVLLCTIVHGQGSQPSGDAKEAKTTWDWGDYRAALVEYEGLIKQDSQNEKLYYRLGVCYYETRSDIDKSVHYFHAATKASQSYPKDLWLRYGKALALAEKFDEAITAFKKVVAESGDQELMDQAQLGIEQCNNAKQLVKFPLKVKLENMGKYVNSPAPEYFPFMDEDESVLYFVTRRDKMNTGYQAMDGWYTAEIFMLKDKRGKWSKAKNAGGLINTGFDDEIVGLSPDGKYMFVAKESFEVSGDIFVGKKKGRAMQKAFPPIGDINSSWIETSGCISSDGNMIIFSSQRPGAVGGKDLWMSKRLPNLEWGIAQPLPGPINTKHNEWMPHLTKDGKTLYFSSQGHSSMGGYDIFTSQWDSVGQQWSTPVNLGYPINTPDDETNITLNSTGRVGYIASARKGGMGGMDIWEVTFPDVDPRYSLWRGKIQVMAPIDYNEYVTFNHYTKNGEQRRFPESYTPDESWEFVESKKVAVKEGYEYKASLTFQKDTAVKRFSLEKAPRDNPEYELIDIKVFQTKKKGYVPSKKKKDTHTPVTVSDAFITVFDSETGDIFGEYLPSEETGRYVMILPPGYYDVEIEAPGYKLYTEKIKVVGKSSFKAEVAKDFTVEAEGVVPSVHFSELVPVEPVAQSK